MAGAFEDKESIKAELLLKLVRKGKWEHAHTPLDRLTKQVSIKVDGKLVKECVDELWKEGLIHIKPTGYGKEVSLNSRMKSQILAMVERFFPEFKEFF